MSHPGPWFNQGELRKTFEIGNTIELSKPEPRRWAIIATADEVDSPTYESDGVHAFTSSETHL